jgi:thiamine-monophosphate kinase
MNEFELIARLTSTLPRNASVLVGPGDDCAVVEPPAGADTVLLLKTDAVVSGVHFTPETPPEQVGHKALGRCLSDIAAMGGTPLHALVTLGLPKDFDADYLDGVYAGLNDLARRYDVAIVGGETVLNPDRLMLSVAVVGSAPRNRVILRSGARPGDAIFVSGRLGGSLEGHHLDFEPRLAEAQWLARHFSVHAMIDLSDGLAGDLGHILEGSGVGAELLAHAIPISRAARRAAKAPGAKKTALLASLTDGEDFELLFTVASSDAVSVLDGWKQQFPGTPLTCIGKITAERQAILRTREGPRPLPKHGYLHFS